MRILLLFILMNTAAGILSAAEVIMVQREFPMKNDQEETPADVYVNKSYNAGELLAVARKVFLKTPESMQKLQALDIPFCLIKVIYSKNSISIGRVVYIKEKENLPNIEHYSPIIGDTVLSPDKNMISGYKKAGKVSYNESNGAKQSRDPIQKKKLGKFEIVL